MPEPFCHTCRVEFRDTDAAGIVHFSVYFNYMEEAEHAFLRTLGLSVLVHDEEGPYSWPRVTARCSYTGPLHFGDDVDVELTLLRLGTKSVTYRFDFLRDGTSLGEGQVTAVCCRLNEDGSLASVPIPAKIRELFEPFISD